MYFPYQKGRYEVVPGLLPLTQDFGNGPMDQRLMQIGEDFSKYRQQFVENRSREPVSKYVILSERAEPSAVGQISEFIFEELAKDYPQYFSLIRNPDSVTLETHHTHERFKILAKQNQIQRFSGEIAYVDAWDAVGAQIPEDLAIWKLKLFI